MEIDTASELAIAPMVGIALLVQHVEKHGAIHRAVLSNEIEEYAATLPHDVAALMLRTLVRLLREPLSGFELSTVFGPKH